MAKTRPKEIEIHAGHWTIGTGAQGYVDEVRENRRVGRRIHEILRAHGVPSTYYEDNVSKNQAQNLNNLVLHHNRDRDGLVVSVHFNSFNETANGTEVLYYDQRTLAEKLSAAMATAGGFANRGAKQRIDLAVLARTYEPAVLLEVCFITNRSDVEKYQKNFEAICFAVAQVLAAEIGYKIRKPTEVPQKPQEVPVEKKEEIRLNETGREAIRNIIRKAVKAGIFNAKAHTEERIKSYDDGTLLSYFAAYVDRTSK